MIFHKEAEFQDSPTGKIPMDWEAAKLEDLATYINGFHFSPREWTSKGLPIIRIQNLNDKHAEFNCFQGDIEKKYVVENGDLLFSWSASIGAYVWDRGEAVLNQHIFKVVPKEGVDKSYLFYALFLAIQLLASKVHGSTMKHFKKEELKTPIPFPPMQEQRAIARILGFVDSAIELVDKVIAKTERLKKGLMQKLLTEGIGHTEYKDTPIGKIAESWQIADFNTICQDIIGGVAIETKDFTDSGFPVVSKGDIKEFGQLVLDKKEKKYVSEEFAEMYPNQMVHQGELVLAMRDLSTEMNFLGLAARVTDDHDYLAAQGVGILRINEEIVEPDFITNLTNSKRYREFIKRRGVGSTQVHLRTNELLSFKFGLPPLSEQRQIVSILSIADQKLKLEKQEKAKLEQLKLGLMDLLLTGKVRVRMD